jgi:hypothetical protein
VWSKETAPHVTYFVRTPWEWVMQSIAAPGMTQVTTPAELPSEREPRAPLIEDTAATPSSRRRRNAAKKFKGPATLKIEITNPQTGILEYVVHGTSSALDGMEDKDEFVRTLQRCRCDNLNLSPPSILLSWDITKEECHNVLGSNLPTLLENSSEIKYAVLKEPMGSQGQGIYFVSSAEEIHEIIDEHRVRAQSESDFLDNLIAVKGRIPSWGKLPWSYARRGLLEPYSLTDDRQFLPLCDPPVLQAEVYPALLIKSRRKFHIRTYLVILEKLGHRDVLDLVIYNRHEVRIAGVPVPENDTERDPVSHITNGALSDATERVMLHEVDELTRREVQRKTEVFVAETFGKHLLPDMERRINQSANQEGGSNVLLRKFALAGLDIMVTEDNRIYLLEVNSNPAAPPEWTVHGTFREHLQVFLHSLVDLVVGKPSPDFLSVNEILVREGLAD